MGVATKIRFGDSAGLFGDFRTGRKLSRGGTVIESWDDFGMEWQVNESEPMLFGSVKGPQLPHEHCKMPDPTVVKAERKRRRLRGISQEAAEDACAGVDLDDFEFCVSDVIAMNDAEVASAY